ILLQSDTALKSSRNVFGLKYRLLEIDGASKYTEWNMKKILGFGLGLYLAGSVAFAQTLALGDYLKQVESQGPDYQSAQAAVVGLEKQSHQQDLTYSPVLVAGYNHFDDQEQQTNPFLGPHTQTDTAGVSISDGLPVGPTVSGG